MVQYIRTNYMGATINIFTTVGVVTGEVVDGLDTVIGLRTAAGVTVFINGNEIVGFN